MWLQASRPLFTKQADNLPQYLVKSRSRDSGLDFSIHFVICQNPLLQFFRIACQITERSGNYNIRYHGFEVSRDLALARPSA